jgi:hypothetical protein
VARLVEEEVQAALAAAAQDAFSAAEIQAAGGDAALLSALRERRSQAERIEALRRGGLSGLDRDELERVLELARGR